MSAGGRSIRVVLTLDNQLRSGLTRASRQVASFNRMGSTVNNTYSQVSRNISNAARHQYNFNSAVRSSLNPVKMLGDAVKSLAVTYLGINAAQTMIETADAVILTTARLDNFNNSLKSTAELTDDIYSAAQRSRASYLDMMDLVAKYSAVAGDKFGSTDNVVAFTEVMQKMFTVSGATGQEIYSAGLQLKQALGTGRLMGEEFRAVAEAAPLYTQAIAKYMTEMNRSEWGDNGKVTVGHLKELASESQITADIMIGAMFSAADEIDQKFKNMPMTFEQAWTKTKNTVVKSLDEVWVKLSGMLSNGELDNFLNNLGQMIVFVGNLLVTVFILVIRIYNFFADNWSKIAPIIFPIVFALLAYVTVLKLVKMWQAICTFGTFAFTIAKMALGLATSYSTKKTMLQTAAQWGLNKAQIVGLIIATQIILIIALIVAGIYILIGVINKLFNTTYSATGVILGTITTAIAIIWNIFLALIDFILSGINIIANKFIMFANFFGNLFRDPIASIIHAFGDMADQVLQILQTIASAIDKVFGTKLGDGLQGWRDGLSAKVDAAANKYGNGSYEKVANELNLSSESLGLKRWSYGDAWKTGYGAGEKIDSFISNPLGSGVGDLSSAIGDYDWSKLADDFGLSDIAGDVGDIADSTEMSNEDLKYLRQIAEQRAINRFTTAEIKIDMNNSNTISGTQDIDGIVKSLEEKLYESMSIAAEGVHI